MINSIPYNYHTHTTFCDGTASLEEMVQSAIRNGLRIIGFSGHSYTAYDESYCMSLENTKKYWHEIQFLKKKYADQIEILCGIEQDFGSDEPTDDYDYVIGSVHAVFPFCQHNADAAPASGQLDYFHGYDRSHYDYIDWDLDCILKTVKEQYNGDAYTFIDHYYQTVAQLPAVTGCHIIGHFDLITKFNEKTPWFDEKDSRYRQSVCSALDQIFRDFPHSAAAEKSGTFPIFEINTGAISRGWRSVPYPSADILKEIQRRGGKVMINSDSHAVDTLTYAFDQAVQLARSCGFTSVSIITADSFREIPL